MSKLGRRRFAQALGIGAGALAMSPFARMLSADTHSAPKRLLIAHFPSGTVTSNWMPSGGERDFVLGPILRPFEAVREHMVVLEGLNIVRESGTPGDNHGSGMIQVMSGGSPRNADGFQTPVAKHPSIDQLVASAPGYGDHTRFASLQLAADVRADRDDLYHRVMSYAGAAAPLPPEQRPAEAYARVFGELMPGGATDETRLELERARSRRQSVLDFLGRDLGRLSSRAPADQRPKLDAHLEAIRELERTLDDPAVGMCEAPDELGRLISTVDGSHGAIGQAHLSIVKTAFACDLTRVATFMWAPGTSHVNFSSVLPGVESKGHHAITHSGGDRTADLTAIDTWYCERMAQVVQELADTPEGDGSLLDSTLVVFMSEMARGGHSFTNCPFVLFGGSRLGLEGGRFLEYSGRSSNDLWVTVANAMGLDIDTMGDADKCRGALPGLFA